MYVLRAGAVLHSHLYEDNCGVVRLRKALSDKAVHSGLIEIIINVIDELDEDDVGVVGENFAVYAVYGEIRVGSADTCVSAYYEVADVFLPPRDELLSVLVLAGGSGRTCGDGVAEESHLCSLFSFLRNFER